MLLVQGEESKIKEAVSAPDLARWSSSFQRDLFSSLRSEILWRLPTLYLLFGVLSGFIMSYHPNLGKQQALFVLLGGAVLLLLQFYVTRVSDTKRLMDLLYLICGLTAIVPFGFLVSWQYDYFFLLLVFFTQAMCWMIFPWSITRGFCWAVFLFSYWAIILNLNEPNIFHCLPLVPIMSVAVLVPRIKYQEINLHQSHLFMTKLSTATQNTLELCFSLLRLIIFSLDSKKALIVMQDGRLFCIGEYYCSLKKASTLQAGSLFTILKDRKEARGSWSINKEDFSSRAFLWDLLETKSRKYLYYFVRTVDKGKEVEALFLIPKLNILDSICFTKLRAGINSLVDIYNISLFTLRNQNMSNETVLAYGTAIADREKDINELVHTVNNNSQEIAIYCDLIKQKSSSSIGLNPEAARVIAEGAGHIEDNLRILTQNVSDIKLIREISALRSIPRKEQVPLIPMFAGLAAFARTIAASKNCEIQVENLLSGENDGVTIPSSDYFETIMRTLVRQACVKGPKQGQALISVCREGEYVCFSFAHETEEKVDEEIMSAVKTYVKFSGGIFEEVKGELQYKHHIKVKFPYTQVTQIKQSSSGSWILLVDDSPQVITFYSRIAEALGMHYYIASSYEEARDILNSRGKPRIVITDIQLSNSSGLDLVKYLRENYNETLPVIVVSGNDDIDVSSKAYEAGATKYLKKPLGRKKLFSEIEGLL